MNPQVLNIEADSFRVPERITIAGSNVDTRAAHPVVVWICTRTVVQSTGGRGGWQVADGDGCRRSNLQSVRAAIAR
jgi:hypothetical protein